MNLEDILIEVRNRDLQVVDWVNPEVLLGESMIRVVANGIGSFQLILPHAVNGNLLQSCAALRAPGAGIIVTDVTNPSTPILSGSVARAVRSASADDLDGTWTITGYSDDRILDGVRVYPNGSQANVALQPSEPYTASGNVETVLRSAVVEQIGTGKPRRTGLRQSVVFESNKGKGPTRTFSADRFGNLLAALQGVAADSGILFRMVQLPAGILFRVSEEQDLTLTTTWDIDVGQITEENTQIDAPNLTHAIVEGDSDGASTAIVSLESSQAVADWGIPFEEYYSEGGSDLVKLTEKANMEVMAGAAQSGFSVTPREDISGLITSMLGARISVAVGEDIREARLNEVMLSLGVEGVRVSGVLGNPDGTDWEGMQNSAVDSLGGRVSAIEQRAAPPYGKRRTFTPVINNGVSLGNGSLTGFYTVIGDLVLVEIRMDVGSSTSVTSDIQFVPPVELAPGLTFNPSGGRLSGGGISGGAQVITLQQNQVLYARFNRISGSNVIQAQASSTVPAAWSSGMTLVCSWLVAVAPN